MSYDVNRAVLIGRLSKDPELKHIPSGTAVCYFGLAVGGKPKPDGTDTVSFFNIVVWGKSAENCSNYLHKGNQICIDGRLEQRSWTAKDGSKKSTVEVIAERVQFLNTKNGQAQVGSQQPQPHTPTSEDAFYDQTGFDPTPIDPGFYADETPNDPNF